MIDIATRTHTSSYRDPTSRITLLDGNEGQLDRKYGLLRFSTNSIDIINKYIFRFSRCYRESTAGIHSGIHETEAYVSVNVGFDEQRQLSGNCGQLGLEFLQIREPI